MNRTFLLSVVVLGTLAASGCNRYYYGHHQYRRHWWDKVRREGLAIEQKREEPRYRELEPFPPTMNWWASRKLMEHTPRRILVMPLTNPWDNPLITENTTRILKRELLKGGFSDILCLQDLSPENQNIRWPWSKWPDPIRVGRIQYPELAEAAARFQAQAILYGQITIYKPTEPPNIGLKALLVEVRPECCEVVWAMDAVFDAGDLEIWDRAKEYYVQRTAKHVAKDDVTRMEPWGGTRYYGHRLMLVSIDRYLEYCSYEVVKNLRIASRGLRWPHYRYERDVSPKEDPGDSYNLTPREYVEGAKDAEQGEAPVAKSSKKGKGWRSGKAPDEEETRGGGARVYPPYLKDGRKPEPMSAPSPETPQESSQGPVSGAVPKAVRTDPGCLECEIKKSAAQ
jgi:hypothetical protein